MQVNMLQQKQMKISQSYQSYHHLQTLLPLLRLLRLLLRLTVKSVNVKPLSLPLKKQGLISFNTSNPIMGTTAA
jgi:hypothetical protein